VDIKEAKSIDLRQYRAYRAPVILLYISTVIEVTPLNDHSNSITKSAKSDRKTQDTPDMEVVLVYTSQDVAVSKESVTE
jgi:hypothetical protein